MYANVPRLNEVTFSSAVFVGEDGLSCGRYRSYSVTKTAGLLPLSLSSQYMASITSKSQV